MNTSPLQVSAQFAAYLWFLRQPENLDKARADAHDFARRNWEQFLPAADEGFGRLIQTIARTRTAKRKLKAA